MKQQAGKQGKGKGGYDVNKLPARITPKPKRSKPAVKLTYTGPKKKSR